MKRFLPLFYAICFCLSVSLPAQADSPQPDKKRYYITVQSTERTVTGRNSGTTIQVGTIVAQRAQLTKADLANIAKYRFPSHAEALNYLGDYGWQLADTYAYNVAGAAVVTWVLYKEVASDLELSEGLALDE